MLLPISSIMLLHALPSVLCGLRAHHSLTISETCTTPCLACACTLVLLARAPPLVLLARAPPLVLLARRVHPCLACACTLVLLARAPPLVLLARAPPLVLLARAPPLVLLARAPPLVLLARVPPLVLLARAPLSCCPSPASCCCMPSPLSSAVSVHYQELVGSADGWSEDEYVDLDSENGDDLEGPDDRVVCGGDFKTRRRVMWNVSGGGGGKESEACPVSRRLMRWSCVPCALLPPFPAPFPSGRT